MSALTGRARLLLWEYPRGSFPWYAVCLVLALLLLLVPPALWHDPMAVLP